MSIVELLGPKLNKGKGNLVDTTEALASAKFVALYFSAHWCPPCRGFTPKLAEMYTSALQKKGLEIIFVSSDKDEAQYNDYFATQPWLALPYADRDLKAKLSKKFKVSGIPSLIMLEPDGTLITTGGREAVAEDPGGDNLPWRPPTFWEALGSDFLSGTEGDTVSVDDIKGEGKVIGLYFSAHWCPPCRGFTPKLAESYEKHLKAKNLEVIFVSSDRSSSEFLDYYGTQPWLAIPNGDKRKQLLSSRFGVRGIPAFVLVDGATGETITTEARSNVDADPEGLEFPWRPKPVADLLNAPLGPLNEETCFVAMMEGCSTETISAAVDTLTPIAEAAKACGDATCFFYAGASGGPTEQIRKIADLGEPKECPQLILLDIPDNGAFYTSAATEVTPKAVADFLSAFKAGTLARQQLS